MPEFHNKDSIFYQNLIDAGCKDKDIEKYIVLYKNKEELKLENQLLLYRKSLMDDLHQVQYKIDCLDYLMHQLKNRGD